MDIYLIFIKVRTTSENIIKEKSQRKRLTDLKTLKISETLNKKEMRKDKPEYLLHKRRGINKLI